MVYWLQHVLGLDNASGPWYLWWSGACGNLAMVAGVWGLLRKHNCQQHGCWRVGRHLIQETGASVCRRHHPTGGHNG